MRVGFILRRNRLMEATRIKRLFPSNNAFFLLILLTRETKNRRGKKKKNCVKFTIDLFDICIVLYPYQEMYDLIQKKKKKQNQLEKVYLQSNRTFSKQTKFYRSIQFYLTKNKMTREENGLYERCRRTRLSRKTKMYIRREDRTVFGFRAFREERIRKPLCYPSCSEIHNLKRSFETVSNFL